ncbi:MAG: efflux RND transporter permease subunit [Acidobacteriota bacterium]
MSLPRFSIRRPVTVFIAAVAAVVFGLVAFGQLSTDLLPDVTYPSLTIRTELPGAAPVEVETLVTRPVEDAVGVVPNLVRVASSSRAETSEVTLEFAWGTVMDFAALDVRERLDVIRLPIDAEPPVLLRYDPSLDPILRLTVAADTDLVRLRRLAEEEVRRPLERLEDVAAVVVQGGLEEEIQVEIDERKLAALGLDVDTVIQRLAQENVNVTGGRLRDGQSRFMVRTVNEILRPDDLQSLIVGRLGTGTTGTGALVKLSDVATVRQGFAEREIVTRLDSSEAVEVAIFKAGGANTVTVSERVRARLDALRTDLERIDPSLRVEVVSDQATYIESSVREVLETAAIGGILATIVLFLFLRSLKSTAIIAVAIPISVVATFFLMYAFDISLNIMSLGGLTLGIGLLVDNAIVVLESIQRRREQMTGEDEPDPADLDAGSTDPSAGESAAGGLQSSLRSNSLRPSSFDPPAGGRPATSRAIEVDAAIEGTEQVGSAIAASTVTTICVFLPIVFVEGVAAQFFTDQALTVTFSLLVSLAVALTLIPMLASRSAPAIDGEAEDDPRSVRWTVTVIGAIRRVAGLVLRPLGWLLERPAALFQIGLRAIERLYARVIRGALAHPWIVLLIAALLLAISLPLADDLGRELIPELVQGEFFVDLELPPGTHLDVTDRRLAAIERRVAELDDVDRVYSLVGTASTQGGVAGENREHRGQLTIEVAPPFSRQREEVLMDRVREIVVAESDLEARFGRPSYFSFKTPIEIELRGFNLTLLRRLSDRLVAELAATPGFTDVESTAEGGLPELQIRFDRQRLASYGLTIQRAAEVVRAKVQGEVATEIQRQDRTIDIRLRAREADRDSAADLENLVILQRAGAALPLSAVATVTEAEGPAEIRRIDGERAALITANLEALDLAAAALAIEQAIVELDLPEGFDWSLGGQQREMETSFGSMRLAIALAIFLVYLVMASQFESLIHPFVILGSVPLASIGVVATLWLADERISVVVLIGVVLLAGIVVNNAILLVDTANRLRREDGLAKLDAIARAGALRLRPILMTTATTALGLLPMAIGLGEGAELRAPMALVVVGGLLTSTLLTLVVIPVVYRLVGR